MKRSTRGFTLTEIMFAFAILSGVTYVLLSGFLTSAKLSHKSQANLNETMYARLVLEQVADEVRCNPARIGQLLADPAYRKDDHTAVIWGSLAEKPPVAPDGSAILPAENCPFLQGLTSSGKADEESKTKRAALQESFGNFLAKVEVHRLADVTESVLIPEITTRVTVEIYASKAKTPGPQTPAEVLSTEVLTPIESMSVEGVARFNQNFPLFDAKEAKEKILARLESIDRYTSAPWDEAARSLLTSMLLLYRNVRLEQALTKGIVLGKAGEDMPPISPEKSLEGLIAAGEPILQATGSAKVRQHLANLSVRTAQAVLDSFKSSRMILEEDIVRGHQNLIEEIREMREAGTLATLIEENNKLRADVEQNIPGMLGQLAMRRDPAVTDQVVQTYTSAAQRTKAQLEEYSSELLKRRQLWLRSQLFRWFYQEPVFKMVQDRLKEYPDRFPTHLVRAQALTKQQLEAKDGPTSLQRLFAVGDGIDLSHALRLYGKEGPQSETERNAASQTFQTLAKDFPAMTAYAVTLRPEDPVLRSMGDRFPNYTKIASDLGPLDAALLKEEELHEDRVEKPLLEVGEIASALVRTTLEMKLLNRNFLDESFLSILDVSGSQRVQISEATGFDPTGAEILRYVGDAFKLKIVPFEEEAVKPHPAFTEALTYIVKKIRKRPADASIYPVNVPDRTMQQLLDQLGSTPAPSSPQISPSNNHNSTTTPPPNQ